ncbi:SDR family oxidoreductase [Paenibacillus sp. LMG 31461]|uniref:SDR family oxidoreductase n=1 Tax=Paenibacillus plantarum TaxID=2654975 RepID=A0ABX1XHP6_9BACL|nr:SDR family oxidoreductase [Paenibacillus plantarum]NOU67370.1 SDR family oxidoreductase [Paenibacillus plantarum]
MSKLQLADKVICITGAQGTAGRAAVKLFLEKGASVAACDLKEEEKLGEMKTFSELFGSERFLYIQADVTDEQQVNEVFSAMEAYFGRLDGLYHNAYVNHYKRIAEQSLASWNATINGTLTSTFLTCKYAAELMVKSSGGSIVNNSSILGSKPLGGNASYGAAKAGLEQFTKVMAVEYADQGIRANSIVPGDFRTEIDWQTGTEEFKESMRKTSLIGRSGKPNEINEVAAFLLSDAASYITGSTYPVTGGLWL